MKYIYPEFTGEVNDDNTPTTVTKIIEIKEDLMNTLNDIGLDYFLMYMPIKYIEQLFKTNEKNQTFRFHYFCGDLPCKFPGGKYRDDVATHISDGNKEITLEEAIMQGATAKHQLKPAAAKQFVGHSDRMLHKTESEFFTDIDNAIDSCGLSKDTLICELKAIENKEYDNRDIALEAFYRKIWPVYICLRKMGYSHPDLF